MRVQVSGQTCGALIHELDLTKPIDDATHRAIRETWIAHQVIGITGQQISVDQLEQFATRIGPFGEDPFIASMPDHDNVIEVRREPDEKAGIFAGNWHSDWSFLAQPPAGTILYGEIIPPVGGDTLFANLYAAYDALPTALRTAADNAIAVHSASRSYSPEGRYGKGDDGRSMQILANDSANAIQSHPLVRTHPESGRKTLFASPAYTLRIENMSADEGEELLQALFAHMDKPEFTYQHQWQQGMLTLWDNRCLNHKATGGYEGHRRLLYRITVGEQIAA